MQRYKLIIAYDGTRYVGYQVQQNGNSIQAELNRALLKMSKGQAIGVTASSRTDSGVHALGQVAHIDYPAVIQQDHFKRALNSILPDDILIRSVEMVDATFHARYSASGKQYLYRVALSEAPDPFKRLYTVHHPYRCNLERMQQALLAVVGTHDFTSFCSIHSDKEDKVRTLTKAEVTYDQTVDELVFTFAGDGFLYNMVRILVGTTLQIGDGLKPVNELARLLEVRDRRAAGPTAPPHGLYLAEVFYPSGNK